MAPLDFAAVHFYPSTDKIDEAIEALKLYDIGKPLVIEEMFPLSCPMEQLVEFINKSRPICDGWVSFYWGRTIEECKDKGDLSSVILAAWLEKFRALGTTMAEHHKQSATPPAPPR